MKRVLLFMLVVVLVGAYVGLTGRKLHETKKTITQIFLGQHKLIYPSKFEGGWQRKKDVSLSFVRLKLLYPGMIAKSDAIPKVGYSALDDREIRIHISYVQSPPSLQEMYDLRVYRNVEKFGADIRHVDNNLTSYAFHTSAQRQIYVGTRNGQVVWLTDCAVPPLRPVCQSPVLKYRNLSISYSFLATYVKDWEALDSKIIQFLDQIIVGDESVAEFRGHNI